MKISNLILIILFVVFTSSFTTVNVNAQKPESELNCEEFQALLLEWQTKVDNLYKKFDALKADADNNKAELTRIQTALEDCNKELYAMIEASLQDIDDYRQKLGRLDGKVRNMESRENKQEEIDAVWAELNELRKDKLALLPEFYNKIIDIARRIKNLKVYVEKPSGYTVGTWAKDRDCLWNIAGKMEIYGDPLQWPKIWHDNIGKIRNPDIIFPGQLLTIPPQGPKTDEEIKLERKYWRQKRAAAAAAEQPVKGTNNE